MTDPDRNGHDHDAGERPMTSADLTAHDPERGQERREPSQQEHHEADTEEDTASGGAPE